jgi:hypothetical protein
MFLISFRGLALSTQHPGKHQVTASLGPAYRAVVGDRRQEQAVCEVIFTFCPVTWDNDRHLQQEPDMPLHHYRITVEALDDAGCAPLRFETENHDNLYAIVEKLGRRDDLAPNEILHLALGLKLFGKVLMENRENPLFGDFSPHFMAFMKNLKQSTPKEAQ